MANLSREKGYNRPHIGKMAILGMGLCLLLGGCTTGKHSGSGDSSGTGGASSGGSTLRYALIGDLTTLDPALVEDGTTIDLLQNVFEGLVKWDDKNQIVPNIAEKWDISPDGTVYRFHLKKGVKFSNGREVTAQDFKYSIDRCCDPATKSPNASTYLKDIVGAMDFINRKPGVKEVSGVKVIDPYTLQITIDAFKPYWLGDMTFPTAYVVCKEAIDANGGQLTTPEAAIGTGPYILTENNRNNRATLKANPHYHDFPGSQDGKPTYGAIERPILTDGTTRLNNFEQGQLDFVDVSPRDLDTINSDPNLKDKLKSFPRAAIWYLALNQLSPNPSPFAKKEVRQAFAYAIDKNELKQIALRGQAEVANGIVPPGVPGYNPNVQGYPFDPAKAKQLLAQAGYPGGKNFPPLTLTYRQGMPQVEDTVTVLVRQLNTNLGINIQARQTEWGQMLKERNHKTLPMYHIRWAADYLDPQDFLSVMLHTSHQVNGKEDHEENAIGYSSAEFDRLCDAADVEHDPQKRLQMYQQAEQIAVNDAPWVPLYFQKDIELVSPRITHLRDSLFGHLPYVTLP